MLALKEHVDSLLACRRCPEMIPPVVSGRPIHSKVMLVGQAPGSKEGSFGKPFAWTAGKTMFKWFGSIGVEEEQFRSRVYMAAVCRCFPGKAKAGGDRVPNDTEIANCRPWMEREFELLKPELVIAVGRLAIDRFLQCDKLAEVIGRTFPTEVFGVETEILPLPHPSPASSWFKTEPGKSLLGEALGVLSRHPAWLEAMRD